MKKKVTLSVPKEAGLWDPATKEAWHVEFEKEPINDERWYCFVSAIVQAKAQDEEGIQILEESLTLGLKKNVKLIKMADVMKLLKGNNGVDQDKKEKNNKSKKNEKLGKKFKNIKNEKEENKGDNIEREDVKGNKNNLEFSMTRTFPIVELAKQYAIFTESECILPPDLMAGVLKYLILYIKEENIFWKKVQNVKERKAREAEIKANFIKTQLPFVVSTNTDSTFKISKKIKEITYEEPVGGPDVYIILSDFFNPYYFTKLSKINVPFITLFKIRSIKDLGLQKLSLGSISIRPSSIYGKKALIIDFWKKLSDIPSAEFNSDFKNFLLLEFQLPFFKSSEYKQQMYEIVLEEFVGMLYQTYHVYRQHKSYLQELFVQRMVKSLEPLDLSKCNIYNKLCDILITGMPNTIYLILYAIIEQIVAGIPKTKFIYEEYEPEFCDFFSCTSELDVIPGDVYKDSKGKAYLIVTPCLQCRDKKFIPPGLCRKPSFQESDKL